MVSGSDVEGNLRVAGDLIARAADAGAKLVLLPENFALMGRDERDKVALREPPGTGKVQGFLAESARRHRVWLAGGTAPVAAVAPDKVRGACLLYDERGEQVARYDKMHLFDVLVGERDRHSYRESAAVEAGTQVVVAATPFANVGLSVCYDLRFPELYRAMHAREVQLLLVPAAFTEVTGRAHWSLLLRTRAVENLCYVLASNQGGSHADGRATYGHSMVVDPWGEVLAECTTGADVVVADMDLQRLAALRRQFPVLHHRCEEYPLT